MDLKRLEAFCSEKGMPLAPEQVQAFESFASALYRLNEVMNLTRVPRDECEIRHFIDSLLITEFIPTGSAVLDVGTGTGLPAWPLACARPDLRVTAIDSSAKALLVLQETPLPNLTFRQERGESLGARESFDFVTGRAVAPLAVQLEISAAWAKIGGVVVPFRTPNESFDLDPIRLGLVLERVEQRPLPHTDAIRAFPIYLKAEETPMLFPRTWAQIKKRPIG